MKRVFTALALLLALAPAASPVEGFRIVVNEKNPAATLTRSEVARMFMKKTTEWPGGLGVAPVDQERTSATRDAFSREILQKDADSISAYWQTLVYSGRETPPPVRKSDAEVVEYVRGNRGAIGYVSGSTAIEGLKAVSVR
jgi:ABC-type phosphate transport system substrate-binding protein